MFQDHTPPWATDKNLAVLTTNLVFEIALYQVAITDAGIEIADEASAMLAGNWPLPPCEVDDCESEAAQCPCGCAHCPDHPHT